MSEQEKYWKGILVGFAVSTIVWCTLWAYVVGKISDVHQQELDYVIEKHIQQELLRLKEIGI